MMLHTELYSFRSTIKRSIEKNIIKHFAKQESIPYKKAIEIIEYLKDNQNNKDFNSKYYFNSLNLLLNGEDNEKLEKPSKIYERIKNIDYDEDFIKKVSSNEFMSDYHLALEKLDGTSRLVMQLSFDKDGNAGLTDSEIEDYLGINQQKILYIRKKAIKALKQDEKLNSYIYN